MTEASTNTTRSTVAIGSETLSPPTDRLPSTPMLPATDRQAGMSPLENALRDTKEVMATINLTRTWEGGVARLKWVMDALSPVAEVRYNLLFPIFIKPNFVLSFIRMQRWHMVYFLRFPR